MMDLLMIFVPNYKKETGVQKINTVFLTDGVGCRLERIYHVNTTKDGKTYNGYSLFSLEYGYEC